MVAWMLAALVAGTAPIVADTGLVVRAVRFYRADPGQSPGQTQVAALIRIPSDLPRAGQLGEVSLTLSLRVTDQAGKTLYEQSWQKRSVLPSPRGEADRLDLFRFTLGAGRYRLEAAATDSVSGRRMDAAIPIEGYDAPPPASDLVLVPWLRPVAAADTVPQPGEIRRGGFIAPIAPTVVVGGPSATLAYLIETYAGLGVDATLALTVSNGQGGVVERVGPAPVRIVAGIGLLSGQLDVGSFEPGTYRLDLALTLGGRTVERSGDFVLDPAAASTPSAITDRAYFDGLSGGELDRAFQPLSAIATAAELAHWPAKGRDEEKRAFLVDFWGRRNAGSKVPGNERRVQFYDAVTYANSFYGEPRRRLAGWQTDRGRVFLREGLPTQVLRRQQRGTVPAYEVWRYFDKGKRYYIFADPPPAGSYRLIRSNDPSERNDRRWQQVLTPTGVREIVAFLGRDVLTESP